MLTNIEVLAIFGAGTLVYWFGYAAYYITDAALVAFGYLGLYAKSFRWRFLAETPRDAVVDYIRLFCYMASLFLQRLGNRGEWKSTFEITDTGEKWEWEPYFKYTRIEDERN